MNNVHVLFGRGDAALALLLKAVKDEHSFRELDGVDGPIGVALVVLDHLQHAGRTETRHDLGILVLATRLS